MFQLQRPHSRHRYWHHQCTNLSILSGTSCLKKKNSGFNVAGVSYRVFHREVDNDELIIRHLPRSQSHHVSVPYQIGTDPCKRGKNRE